MLSPFAKVFLLLSIVSLCACHGSVDYLDLGDHRAGIFSVEIDGSGLEPLWLGDVPFTMLELSPDESTVVLSLFQEDVNGDGLYNDLDFSSTAIWPRTTRCALPPALTMCSAEAAEARSNKRRKVFPSTAITP